MLSNYVRGAYIWDEVNKRKQGSSTTENYPPEIHFYKEISNALTLTSEARALFKPTRIWESPVSDISCSIPQVASRITNERTPALSLSFTGDVVAYALSKPAIGQYIKLAFKEKGFAPNFACSSDEFRLTLEDIKHDTHTINILFDLVENIGSFLTEMWKEKLNMKISSPFFRSQAGALHIIKNKKETMLESAIPNNRWDLLSSKVISFMTEKSLDELNLEHKIKSFFEKKGAIYKLKNENTCEWETFKCTIDNVPFFVKFFSEMSTAPMHVEISCEPKHQNKLGELIHSLVKEIHFREIKRNVLHWKYRIDQICFNGKEILEDKLRDIKNNTREKIENLETIFSIFTPTAVTFPKPKQTSLSSRERKSIGASQVTPEVAALTGTPEDHIQAAKNILENKPPMKEQRVAYELTMRAMKLYAREKEWKNALLMAEELKLNEYCRYYALKHAQELQHMLRRAHLDFQKKNILQSIEQLYAYAQYPKKSEQAQKLRVALETEKKTTLKKKLQ